MTLASLAHGYRAMIFGSSGGVGGALVAALSEDPRCGAIYAGSRRSSTTTAGAVRPFTFDLADERTIADAAAFAGDSGPLDLVMIATGALHANAVAPEKTYRALEAASLAHVFAVNAIGPALIAKHVLPLMAKGRKAVFIALSARVGSIEDNRLGGWHAYRMSKAALNMLIRTVSIEMATRNRDAIVAALHPGTVDTALSAPFQRGVAPEKLFTPAYSASRLLRVVDELSPADSGGFFSFDGAPIPF